MAGCLHYAMGVVQTVGAAVAMVHSFVLMQIPIFRAYFRYKIKWTLIVDGPVQAKVDLPPPLPHISYLFICKIILAV